MHLRKYHPDDCKELIALFYDTVHSINVKDYSEDQIFAWASKNIDASAWNVSLLKITPLSLKRIM